MYSSACNPPHPYQIVSASGSMSSMCPLPSEITSMVACSMIVCLSVLLPIFDNSLHRSKSFWFRLSPCRRASEKISSARDAVTESACNTHVCSLRLLPYHPLELAMSGRARRSGKRLTVTLAERHEGEDPLLLQIHIDVHDSSRLFHPCDLKDLVLANL